MRRPRPARQVALRASLAIAESIREEVMLDWLAAEMQFQLRHAPDDRGEIRMRPRGAAAVECFRRGDD